MGREIAMQRQTRRERGRDKKISTVEKNAIVRLARRQKKTDQSQHEKACKFDGS